MSLVTGLMTCRLAEGGKEEGLLGFAVLSLVVLGPIVCGTVRVLVRILGPILWQCGAKEGREGGGRLRGLKVKAGIREAGRGRQKAEDGSEKGVGSLLSLGPHSFFILSLCFSRLGYNFHY
jgi:hypothetical protein